MALLRRQHGSAEVSQLRGLGFTDHQIRQRIRRGLLIRAGRGVVTLPGGPGSLLERASLATLRAGDDAVCALWTAAELHRLDAPRDAAIHVVVPWPLHRRSSRGIVIHRSRYLPPAHRTAVRRVPVTTVDRTVVDCARLTDRWSALAMLDSASLSVRQWSAIHSTAARLSNGRAGVRALVDATAPDGGVRFRSRLERLASTALAGAGIGDGRWNRSVSDRHGDHVREADLVFDAERLIVELDGLRFHRPPDAAQRDRTLDRRLQLAGWRVLRFTWRDVVDRTATVVGDVRIALGR